MFIGDLNAHHPNWGDHRSDPRGIGLANIFDEEDLVVLNDGSPTFYNGRFSSAIDVSAVSRTIANRFIWTINPDLSGSDHHPIQITMAIDAIPVATRRPRWRYDQADWTAFAEFIDASLQHSKPTTIEAFTELTIKAANAAIPKTGVTIGRKSLRWWSEETKTAIKARRKALRRLKKLPANHPDKEAAAQAYRDRHNQCRQTIREAKRNSWTEFLESINETQTASDLWGRVNAISGKRRQAPMALVTENGFTSDPTDVATLLGTYFAKLSAIEEYPPDFIRRVKPSTANIANFPIPPDPEQQTINRDFSLGELSFALRSCKGSSAGLDEIGYPMLKNLPLNAKLTLLDILNNIWQTGSYPSAWRQSLVVPIPKPSATTRGVEKYRPIALTSCLSKTLERMVNRRLKHSLEEGGHLDFKQHAFRAGRGTSTYFTSLADVMQDVKDRGHHAELVSLDLSKAFNRTWTPFALEELTNWGFCGNMISFLRGFLTDRSFRVAIGNTFSDTFPEETGVPQGSVIAVTLFLVAMNRLFRDIPANVHIYVYADDILIVTTGRTIVRTRIHAQAAVNAAVKWAETAGFQLSASKSTRCHVCLEGHRISGTGIKIKEETIPSKKSIRILGVTVDRQLTFKKHFDSVKSACKTRINLLRTISRPHRSNNRRIRLRVARAIVDSRLLYGLELTVLSRERLVHILAPTFNTYVRVVSGLLPSTPADSACVEAGILPFRYQVDAAIATKAASFLAKTAGNARICLLNEGNRVLQTAVNQDLPPIAKSHWLGSKGWHLPETRIENSIQRHFKAGSNNDALRRSVTEMVNSKYANYTKRFTDGSKAHTGVGVGVSGDITVVSSSLADQCSVFSAEAAAVFLAATAPASQPILILSDSQSVISALSSESPTHPWIQAIIRYAPPSTVYAWVPGHCGIPGNVEADQLAGAGSTGPRVTDKVPLKDAKKWIKNVTQQHWQKLWMRTRGPLTRIIKETIYPWDDLNDLREQRVISRLRTGHSSISHCYDGGNFRRTCSACQLPATVEHLLCACQELEAARMEYGIVGNINLILGDELTRIAALIAFLKETGLFFKI